MRRRRHRSQRSFPVYAMPAVIVVLGLGALILSIAWPGSTTSSSAASSVAILKSQPPDLTAQDKPVTSRAKRASEAEQPADSASEPEARAPAPAPPPRREAAPSEALQAVKAKGLGISTGRGPTGGVVPSSSSSSSTSLASGSGPFTVAVVPEGTSEVDAVATDLVSRLKRGGIDARVTPLDDAGRPDAVVVLGASGSAGSETWYCDPGPAASVQLARTVMQAVPNTGSGAAGPHSAFPCEDVHAGRARVPAVLTELPAPLLAKRDPTSTTLDGLASGISRYLAENATTVKQARNAAKLIWPATGPITSYYGPSHPLGIDIGQWQGNIIAATAGTVVWAGGDPCCNYGRYVVVQSTDGIETLYAHFQSLAVRKGQKVRQGQVLGLEGCTGHCSGPHLHFEVYDNGRRQDPMRYLP